MNLPTRIVVFALAGQRYGLTLETTQRVVPAVEVTPLPKAPAIVHGVFNLHGRIIPVVNTRRRFALPERAISPADHFVVTCAAGRTIALVVDETLGVITPASDDLVAAAEFLPAQPFVRGVVRLPDGLVLIHDVAAFLALDEAAELDVALRQREGVPA